MHIDAFFDYLLGRLSAYWLEVPSEHAPIAELERDGVAAEDDMALRALMPHIKPRRGRRKPDDDDTSKSPSKRPSPQADEEGSQVRQGGADPWTAQPVERGSVFVFPPVPDPSRLHPSAGAPWGNNDIVQTPMTAYPIPQSAITPSTRNAFWADEPKSAITPSKGRPASRRHGAKVVSSAWRSSAIGGTGKARGRPPINRSANVDGPFSAFPTASDGPVFRFPSPVRENGPSNNSVPSVPTSNPLPATTVTLSQGIQPQKQTQPQPQPAQNPTQPSPISESPHPRPAKRSRLSLQVPERVGGEVRLATPPLPEPQIPPTVVVNGHPPAPQPPPQPPTTPNLPHPNLVYPLPSTATANPNIPNLTAISNLTPSPHDRTNIDAVTAFFTTSLLRATWLSPSPISPNSNPIRSNPNPPTLPEAYALSRRVITNLLAAGPTKEAFLINLSALAGGMFLLNKGSLKITRLKSLSDRTRYSCTWQLRYGDIVGEWRMEETVLHADWKTEKEPSDGSDGDDDGGSSTGIETGNCGNEGDVRNGTSSGGGSQSQEGENEWEKKYRVLAETLRKRDEEMIALKTKLVDALRD